MLKHYGLILIVFFSFSLRAFTQTRKSEKEKPSSESKVSKRKKITKSGVASFYANKFNGRRTASGEIYRHEKFTAACNQLPLNTWIKVTCLRNHRSVIVRVNDRLNSHNKRLVDLSRAAADKLGFTAYGITKVKVEVLNNYSLSK